MERALSCQSHAAARDVPLFSSSRLPFGRSCDCDFNGGPLAHLPVAGGQPVFGLEEADLHAVDGSRYPRHALHRHGRAEEFPDEVSIRLPAMDRRVNARTRFQGWLQMRHRVRIGLNHATGMHESASQAHLRPIRLQAESFANDSEPIRATQDLSVDLLVGRSQGTFVRWGIYDATAWAIPHN
jgi:hypothetical protein